jgi:hypothetical protein
MEVSTYNLLLETKQRPQYDSFHVALHSLSNHIDCGAQLFISFSYSHVISEQSSSLYVDRSVSIVKNE